MDHKAYKLKLDEGKRQANEASYVLNGVLTQDSDSLIQNEGGNEFCYGVSGTILGHINITDSQTIIFSHNSSTNISEIGQTDGCTYTAIIASECLNFSTYVTGFHRVKNGCERIIYFNDNTNPDRTINLDKLEDYKTDGEWDCNKMKLNPDINHPCITTEKIKSGSLPTGSYRFSIELLDESLNSLGFSPQTELIYIYEDAGTVRLNFSQINRDEVAFFRLYTTAYVSGNGVPTFTASAQTYVSSTPEIVYEGIAEGDFSFDEQKLAIHPVRYDTSRHMLQVDKRLVRKNLKEKERDYSKYQPFASKIKTFYKVHDGNTGLMPDEVYALGIVYVHEDGTESPAFHIPANCDTYTTDGISVVTNDRILQVVIANYDNPTNENVSFTIVYEIDGVQFTKTRQVVRQGRYGITPYSTSSTLNVISITPSPDPTDTFDILGTLSSVYTDNVNNYAQPANTLITEWTTDIGHIVAEEDFDAEYPNGIPYHKVFNNAFELTGERGIPGLYECSINYTNPTNTTCVADFWGNDHCGNPLLDQPIRHHRMPNRNLVPEKKAIGLEFENIEYPDGIIGHYFVYTPKNELTKTVVDSGALFNLHENDDYIVFTYYEARGGTPSNFHALYSPTTLTKDVEFDYISVQKTITFSDDVSAVYDYQEASKEYGGDDLQLGIRYHHFTFPQVTPVNYNIESDYWLKPTSRANTDTKSIVNVSWQNSIKVIEIPDSINAIVTMKKVRNNLYCNLEGIEYKKLHNCMLTLSSEQTTVQGDGFLTDFTVFNGFLAGIDANNLNKLKAAVVFALGIGLSAFTGGASLAIASTVAGIALGVGLTAASISTMFEDIDKGYYKAFLDDPTLTGSDGTFLGFGDGFVLFNNEIFGDFCIDSWINYENKQEDEESQCKLTLKLPENIFTTVSLAGGSYLVFTNAAREVVKGHLESKYLQIGDDNKLKLRPIPCPEWYDYNDDHQYHKRVKGFYSLPITYNYCSDCNHLHPNRIIWSNQDFSDTISDGFKIFLNENTTIVGEGTGQITGSHYDKNRLLIRTEQSRFQLAPNPQVINTDIDVAYMGTGDFLSIPPNELVKTNYGAYGGVGRLDEFSTEAGLVSVDATRGDIHIFSSGGIKTISDINHGCYNWFSNNITKHENIILSYDPLYDRLLMVNKDDDWTMSYDFKRDAWVSFHSYVPNYIYNTANHMFTSQDNQTYKHINSNYQNYYGRKYDFIAEIQPFSYQTRTLECVYLYAQVFNDNYEIDYPTFNRIWAYTNQQSTGLLNLEDDSRKFGYSNTPSIVKSDNNYRVCQLRDIQDGMPLKAISNVYEHLPVNTNLNTSQWNMIPLRDKLFNIRMYYRPTEDHRILVDLIQTNTKNSIL